MPIIDSFFVRGRVSLLSVCELYHNLRTQEDLSGALIHAKRHGVEEGYDEATKKVPRLIAKAKRYNLDSSPGFEKCIKELKKAYGLE